MSLTSSSSVTHLYQETVKLHRAYQFFTFFKEFLNMIDRLLFFTCVIQEANNNVKLLFYSLNTVTVFLNNDVIIICPMAPYGLGGGVE